MSEEIFYMLGVVSVGFAVNYSLRALPFLLFAGRDRELPRWVERFGAFVSPVIISALIVYSYSGLAWRSAWPYLAGALTVALQVWKRNALVSIVAGTVLYMALLTCGCRVSRVYDIDADNAVLCVTKQGVMCGDEYVKVEEVPGILEDMEVDRSNTIHIQVNPSEGRLDDAKRLMMILSRAGYRRPILVTERHSEARAVKRSRYKGK